MNDFQIVNNVNMMALAKNIYSAKMENIDPSKHKNA